MFCLPVNFDYNMILGSELELGFVDFSYRYNSRLVYKWNLLTIQGGGDVAAFYICPMGFDPSPMAAAAWCAAASERGVPSDVTVTFSSSRRFRQAALGFRFRSEERDRQIIIMIIMSLLSCFLLYFREVIFFSWIKPAVRLKILKLQPGSTQSTGATAALSWSSWSSAYAGTS